MGGAIPHGAFNDKQSYWGRMIIVLALQSYAECVGTFAPAPDRQAAVEQALLRHHSAIAARMRADDPPFWTCPWGSARYAEVLLGAQWLLDRANGTLRVNITSAQRQDLWDVMWLARTRSEQLLRWEQWFREGDPTAQHTTPLSRCWPNRSDPAQVLFQTHHGVNIMEAIKTGPAWYRVSGNASDRDNAAAALAWIDRWARSADGTFTAPDCLAEVPNMPQFGVETCAVVEEMFSLRTAYEVTGNVTFMDRLEFVGFNALPATTAADFSGNAYYHAVNQIVLNGKTGYGMNGCCTGNVHQGWPKFLIAQVQTMRAEPGTVVLSGYSPHRTTLGDGTVVTVGGQYPFADNATISVTRPPALVAGAGRTNQ